MLEDLLGGTVYTNNLRFKKFFPCSDKTSEHTGHTLRIFIELVGIPTSLHSENHNNFREGCFKRLLQIIEAYQTFTEPHSLWKNRTEPEICKVKSHAQKIMLHTNTPVRL